MSEPAKKTAPAVAPRPIPPAGYTVRMQWLTLRDKDLVIGGTSLFGRVEGRKESQPSGNDIYWSRDDRHYWVGRYTEGELTTDYRLHETLIGTSQLWQG
jgi:hypothetical protein